jgi:hypothetical protein
MKKSTRFHHISADTEVGAVVAKRFQWRDIFPLSPDWAEVRGLKQGTGDGICSTAGTMAGIEMEDLHINDS